MIEITEEYRAAAKKFKDTFGYGVPLAMIPANEDTAGIILKMELCVKNRRDDLLEQCGVSLEEGDLLS